MTLPGKSKTITVEPLRVPEPARDPVSPSPTPIQVPEREKTPV